MVKSRTKVKFQTRRKTNPEVVETIREAMKHKPWVKVLAILSGPKCNYTSLNLSQINNKSSVGDTVLIVGKVLSLGSITKKIKICALSISENAKVKLKESKSEFITIFDEIKKNPKAEGIKILR